MLNEKLIVGLSTGEMSVEGAAALVDEVVDNAMHDQLKVLYAALRTCVWRLLDSRQRGARLEGWLNVINHASGRLAAVDSVLGLKLSAYTELLHSSLVQSELERRKEPLRRKHVREIVLCVFRSGGEAAKKDLLKELGLKEANLTRLMGPLTDRGWFERKQVGREVSYRLTEKGRRECSDFLPSSLAKPYSARASIMPWAHRKKLHAARHGAARDRVSSHRSLLMVDDENEYAVSGREIGGSSPSRVYKILEKRAPIVEVADRYPNEIRFDQKIRLRA